MTEPLRPAPGGPIVKCPTCGKAVVFDKSSLFRPFCSERCRLIDLGEWATERYAIPCEPDEQDPESEDLESEPGLPPGRPDDPRRR